MWLLALVAAPTIVVAYLQDERAYQRYGAQKFLEAWHVGVVALTIAVFAVGCRLGELGGAIPRAARPVSTRTIRFWWLLTTGLTLLGYAVWLAVAWKNGLRPGTIRDFLIIDDPVIFEAMREEYFRTIPGITTCTQFGLAAVPLGMWLATRGERWPLVGSGMLMTIAAARALVLSERLALLELAVPAVFLGLRLVLLNRPLPAAARWALWGAPALGLAGLVAMFAGSEFFRSWRYYVHEFDSYAEFTVWRISGYYSTAHNNAAVALERGPRRPLPYYTLKTLWEFPGLEHTPLAYHRLTGLDVEATHKRLLEYYAAPEFNSEGGLFQPLIEYGLLGHGLFWLGYGWLAGRLYRGYMVGTLAGLVLYPLVALSLLEVPRLLYLCYPRVFPGICALVVVCWLAERAARCQPAPIPDWSEEASCASS